MSKIIILLVFAFVSSSAGAQGLFIMLKEANRMHEVPLNISKITERTFLMSVDTLQGYDTIVLRSGNKSYLKMIGAQRFEYNTPFQMTKVQTDGNGRRIDSTLTQYTSFHLLKNTKTFNSFGMSIRTYKYDYLNRIIRIEEQGPASVKELRSLTCEYYENTDILKSINSNIMMPTDVTSMKYGDSVHYTYKTTLPDELIKILMKDSINSKIPYRWANVVSDDLGNETYKFYTPATELFGSEFLSLLKFDSLGNICLSKKLKDGIVVEHISRGFDATGNILYSTDLVVGITKNFSYNDNKDLIETSNDYTNTSYEYDPNGSLINEHNYSGGQVYSMKLRSIEYR